MSSEQTGDRTGGAVASEEDMETAHNYAEALLKAAEGSGEADGVLEEIEEIDREVYRPHPKFVELLNTSQVSEWERERISDDLFKDRASDLVYRFLRVLNRHGRLGLLPAVAVEMRRAWNKRRNQVPVDVRTAAPLDDAQRTALAERLGRMIGATPILDLSTDPSLIGGMVIRVGDYVYDASVKNRLEQLRQRLIEGKTHEIQSRRDQFSHSA